jgi:hypothetical protein
MQLDPSTTGAGFSFQTRSSENKAYDLPAGFSRTVSQPQYNSAEPIYSDAFLQQLEDDDIELHEDEDGGYMNVPDHEYDRPIVRETDDAGYMQLRASADNLAAEPEYEHADYMHIPDQAYDRPISRSGHDDGYMRVRRQGAEQDPAQESDYSYANEL